MDSPPIQLTVLTMIIALGLLVLYLTLRRRAGGGGKNRRSYPPVAGTILHLLSNYGRLMEYHTELARRYRTYRLLTPTCGYMYTNVDGAKWRHQRKAASHEFSTRVLRDYSSAVFRDTAAELAGIVAAAAGDDEKLDMHDLLMRSTLDSIFKAGFGVSLGVLSGCSDKGASAFARAFDDASEQVLYRLFDPSWKLKRLLNVSSEAAMKRSVRTIDGFVYDIIDRKIEQMGRDQQEFAKKEDILSRFLLERESYPGGGLDNKYLRDIILNFVVAGRDTTAGTLSWFLYVLCRNQHIQDRVAEEVRAATSGDGDLLGARELVERLTDDAIGKMHYLHAALTETLRLYPAVPIDPKCCFSDDTLPDGYAVNKGDLVPYQMGRMQFLWGADAEEFRRRLCPREPLQVHGFPGGPSHLLGKGIRIQADEDLGGCASLPVQV